VRADDLVIEGDVHRLEQVFANLLQNNIKYTDRSGRIRITVDREDDSAIVTIADDGIGIPSEALEQVFEMFSQVRTQQPRPGSGLGIGLTLARTIVQMHGGAICASSAGLGVGSTFTVRLPLSRAGDGTEPAQTEL
jgi:signal transduction histidine kinase